ncbi:MAG: hypothetical protein GX629_06035 [Phycisphaerae bacterium]|jgi:hypothetical protein|nr:hypothetical protein [Phycisphaerae bacterium]
MNELKKRSWLAGRVDAGVLIAIGIVLILLVSWWTYMSKSRSEHTATMPGVQEMEDIPDRIILGNGLEILFPKSVRSDHEQVNRFVADFLNTVAKRDYRQYRAMVTQQRDPVSKDTFDVAYDRMKKIEVKELTKITDPKELKDEALTIELPAYRLKAHAVLRDNSERDVEIIVFKEYDVWVSSN